MMMDFAGRLKRLRIEKGYSQATLAKKSPMQWNDYHRSIL